MNYWQSILEEVRHKGDANFHFRFTDLGESLVRDRKRQQRLSWKEGGKKHVPTFYLGEPYDDVYFTKREAETLSHLLQGKTLPQVGESLSLSARTIEFYVKNMKAKIGAHSKSDLLEKLRNNDIINNLTFEPEEDYYDA